MFKCTETLGFPRALQVSHETNLIVTFWYYVIGTQSQVVEITVTKASVLLDNAHELFTAQHTVNVPLAAIV